jgi:hypothetical protein
MNLEARLSAAWREVCDALDAAGFDAATCLFRTTEGEHAARVARSGTDRIGRPDPGLPSGWSGAGLRGPARSFERALFASTADEIERRLAGRGPPTALEKCPTTPIPWMIVYRRRALARVGPSVYVFRAGDAAAPIRALRLLLPLSAFGA